MLILIKTIIMSKVTIYQVACNKVDGFQEMGEMFMGRLVIDG